MPKGLIAKKIGMTRIFDEDRNEVPVTILECGPCYVAEIRTKEKHGYDAIQLAFQPTREKLLTRAELFHLKKYGLGPFKVIKEFRDFGLEVQPGQEIKVDIFSKGEVVKVQGISKGKGFQGVMKRHGFGGGRMSHGSKFHRAPGSLGSSTFPAEVVKGKRMPGRAGGKAVTIRNLKIIDVDPENNLLIIKGSVPGPRKSILKVEAQK
ncbi:MAG: 50S ribosomal protein L3 [Leptospiraceae bacterium]|nr:50S ribosomal protein L3 [Leptospiraceae bacterium]MDW7975171.1 50S ribosomal protein L3 [Leptospiraceae bacterium]